MVLIINAVQYNIFMLCVLLAVIKEIIAEKYFVNRPNGLQPAGAGIYLMRLVFVLCLINCYSIYGSHIYVTGNMDDPVFCEMPKITRKYTQYQLCLGIMPEVK